MNLNVLVLLLSGIIFSSGNKIQSDYSLTVEVEELRNSKGVVQFALYNKDGSIPDEHYKKYFKKGTATIKDGKAVYTFSEIPEGVYAVNVLHDENSNGKVDKGLLLPKEGIGFSNFETIRMGKMPNFKKASFQVKEHMKIRVKIIYM